MNACGAIATFFSLVAVILIAIGAVLPHFVDVYIVENTKDPTAGKPVAGVGVFNSEYDASVLDAAQLAGSGVPDTKFSTPSLEFPLLFPAQENFVADVLPLTRTTAKELSAVVGLDVEAILDGVLTPVEDLEFDSCEQYIPESLVALDNYFAFLQTFIFPFAVSLISGDIGASFDETFASIFPNVTVVNVQQVVGGILTTQGETVNEALNATVCIEGAGILAATVGDELNCLNAMFNGQAGFLAHVNSCDTAETVSACFFADIDYEVTDGDVDTTVAFSTAGSNFCDVLVGVSCTDNGVSLRSYLSALASFYAAAGVTEVEDLFNLYLAFLDAQLLTSTDLTGTVNTGALTTTFPTTAAGYLSPYPPCILLTMVVAAGQAELPGIFGNETEACTFIEYFPAVTELLVLEGNVLASTVDGVATLYNACFGLQQTENCPALFSRIFLDGAYSGDIGQENYVSAAAFNASGISECEDDVTDHEKITQAQSSLIAGFVFYGIAFLAGVVGLILSHLQAPIFSVAGISSIFAGALTLAALFIVRSAPVYASVGDDAGQFDPFYQEGSVVILALVSSIIAILDGVAYLVAACKGASSKTSADEETDDEVKEKQQQKKAAPQASPERSEKDEEVPVAKAEEKEDDVVPGTDVAI